VIFGVPCEAFDQLKTTLCMKEGDTNLSEPNSNRLFHPHHVREIDPGVGVLDRSKSAGLPGERAIFGKQTTQGAATRTTIEPDGDLLLGIRIGGREEPEEKFASLVGISRDWEKAGIALTDVEGDVWDASAVHLELHGRVGEEVVSSFP
jgi:hypothetical protein